MSTKPMVPDTRPGAPAHPVVDPEPGPRPAEDVAPATAERVGRRAVRPHVAAAWLAAAVALAAIWLVAARHHAVDAAQSGVGKGRIPSVPAVRPGLPPRLLFLTTGLDGGPGPLLFAASGDGSGARPAPGGRFVADFAQSSDGRRSATVDFGGNVRLLPEAVVYPGRVVSVTFSPDGRTVAACTGTWPPHLILLDASGPRLSALDAGPGCDPRWSVTGIWVAYRIPGHARGTFVSGHVGVYDTRTDRRLRVGGNWQPAWAPSGWDGAGSLTLVTRRGIEAVDPVGGGRSVLVPIQRLRAFTSTARPGPITMLSWSPDGRWLAVGFGRGRAQDGAVLMVNPRTGQEASVIFSRSPRPSDATTPLSFSWSTTERLLVQFSGPDTYSQVLGPSGPSSTLALRQPSWSPDGNWVLGQSAQGWVAVDPTNPSHRVMVGTSARWPRAEWCCPPIPTVYATG